MSDSGYCGPVMVRQIHNPTRFDPHTDRPLHSYGDSDIPLVRSQPSLSYLAYLAFSFTPQRRPARRLHHDGLLN